MHLYECDTFAVHTTSRGANCRSPSKTLGKRCTRSCVGSRRLPGSRLPIKNARARYESAKHALSLICMA